MRSFHLGWRTRVHLCQVPRHVADSSVKSGDQRKLLLEALPNAAPFEFLPSKFHLSPCKPALELSNVENKPFRNLKPKLMDPAHGRHQHSI